MSRSRLQETFRRRVSRVGTAAGKPILLTVERDDFRSGDIDFDGTVQVAGHVEGDIRARRIVVATGAIVDGILLAELVYIDGTVNGPIVGGRVSLGPTARIKGNITYSALKIATGASVSGFFQDRARTETAPFKAARPDAVPPLPFSRAQAACRKPTALTRLVAREAKAIAKPQTMRAVWHSYQQAQTLR